MKIIIYGAGGIGSVVGGHLWRDAHEVVLIGRAGHVRAINERGLRLVTPTGTHLLRLPAVTSPDQVKFSAGDVVFLCMKGQNTEEALRNLQAITKDVPIFCLQNGVRNEEIAAQYFPRVYGVMVNVSAVYLNDGEAIARHDPPGWFVIGRYPRGTDELANVVAQKLLDGGFLVKLTPDVMPYKWGKLMANLANAIGAITNARTKDVKSIALEGRQELTDVLKHAGIRWISGDELAKEWPEIGSPLRRSLTPRHKVPLGRVSAQPGFCRN